MLQSDSTLHSWTLQDIPFDSIEAERVRGDAALFQLLAASSFVETDTPLYAGNLEAFCRADAACAHWVRTVWLAEEVRHGQSLRRYVQAVWPEYDWERAYAAFHADYARLCAVEALQPTLGQEMISRCVVEVGTATYYSMIGSYAREPVLRELAARIRADEVHHYRRFLEVFRRHAGEEPGLLGHVLGGRLPVLHAMLARLRMIRDEDTAVPYRYVMTGLPAQHPFRDLAPQGLEVRQGAIAREHYPFGMAARMLLRLLRPAAVLRRALTPLLTAWGRWYITHGALQALPHE